MHDLTIKTRAKKQFVKIQTRKLTSIIEGYNICKTLLTINSK